MLNLRDLELVLLDRDGVINLDSADYIKTPDEWQPIEGSIEAIVRLQLVYKVAVCTNQSGIGRGMFSEEALALIHTKLRDAILAQGGMPIDIYYCPHHPNDSCGCRKPKTELLDLAMCSHDMVPAKTIYVGDSEKDLLAAELAGCISALVLTGNGKKTALSQVGKRAQVTQSNLQAFAHYICPL